MHSAETQSYQVRVLCPVILIGATLLPIPQTGDEKVSPRVMERVTGHIQLRPTRLGVSRRRGYTLLVFVQPPPHCTPLDPCRTPPV